MRCWGGGGGCWGGGVLPGKRRGGEVSTVRKGPNNECSNNDVTVSKGHA